MGRIVASNRESAAAYQSMINRRFMIVPPALLSDGHAEQLEQISKDFPRLLLEIANMRAPG